MLVKEGKESSKLYDDAHDGYDYKKGRFSLRTFKLTGKKKEFILQQHKRGDFNAKYSKFNIVFHNLPFEITSVQIDNEEINISSIDVDTHSLSVEKEFTEIHLFGK